MQFEIFDIPSSSFKTVFIKISGFPISNKKIFFLWPEGIIPDTYLSEMKNYKDLFYNNFGDDDLIILGLSSLKIKNDKDLYFGSKEF